MGKKECLEHAGLQSNLAVITAKEMHLKQKKKRTKISKG